MKSQLNSQPDPEAINYLPHTQEPPQNEAASAPSISNSQDHIADANKMVDSQELDKILKHHTDLINDAEAKRQLLQLALSCLMEKWAHSIICEVKMGGADEDHCDCGALQANSTIDTIEQNMRAKFQ